MTTENDRDVLNNIFSPLLPDISLLSETDNTSTQGTVEDTDAVTWMELEGVKAAEEGATDRAIELFSTAIAQAPACASGYNNRAQALSLKGDIDGALEDLNKAISLLSNDQPRRVASSAYTQRGTIHRLKGDMPAAMEDFKKGAAFGNSFAKQQMVANNPMAALCNKMLTDVMKKLQQGHPLDLE